MTPERMAALHALAFPQERPWSVTEYRELMQHPGAVVFGDEHAFALSRFVADETELLMLVTHPDHRRRGLAQGLVQRWLAKAEARRAASAFLEVASDNTAAIALYLAQGFAEAGRRRAYYARKNAPAADAITMVCDLTQRQLHESPPRTSESG